MLGLSDLMLQYARFVAAVIFSLCIAIVTAAILAYTAYANGYDATLVWNASGLMSVAYLFILSYTMEPPRPTR